LPSNSESIVLETEAGTEAGTWTGAKTGTGIVKTLTEKGQNPIPVYFDDT
jgi:hypothetical protein